MMGAPQAVLKPPQAVMKPTQAVMTARKLVRTLVRDLAAAGLAGARVTDPGRRLRGKLLIVTFHRVLPAEQRARYPLPGLVVTPEELDWHVALLARHFEVRTLSDAVEQHASGRPEGRPLCAITFDDGQLDNYVHARPVLEGRGVRAVFYIPVRALEDAAPLWHDRLGFAALAARARGAAVLGEARALLGLSGASQDVGEMMECAKALAPQARLEAVEAIERLTATSVPDWAGMMRWEQVRELSDAGHEIGSHSMTHPILPGCETEQIEYEVAESRRVLQARVGAPIDSFCYPNGDSDQRAVDAVRRAGYRSAVTTAWGSNGAGGEQYALRRCDMVARDVTGIGGGLSASLLKLRISGLHPSL